MHFLIPLFIDYLDKILILNSQLSFYLFRIIYRTPLYFVNIFIEYALPHYIFLSNYHMRFILQQIIVKPVH